MLDHGSNADSASYQAVSGGRASCQLPYQPPGADGRLGTASEPGTRRQLQLLPDACDRDRSGPLNRPEKASLQLVGAHLGDDFFNIFRILSDSSLVLHKLNYHLLVSKVFSPTSAIE